MFITGVRLLQPEVKNLDKVKRNKIISWVLLISWMIVIFIFSNQTGDDSSSKSKFVIYLFNLMGLDLESKFGDMATFIVRKGAHMTEYFILYLFIYNVIRHYFSLRKRLFLSLIFVFLYACTDEFHQLFIPGRAGAFKDVLIDTGGGMIALILMSIVTARKRPSIK